MFRCNIFRFCLKHNTFDLHVHRRNDVIILNMGNLKILNNFRYVFNSIFLTTECTKK